MLQPFDSLTDSPQATLAAATLVACRPEAYSHDSVAAALQRLAECQRAAVAELTAERDAAVKGERALRRHLKVMLLKFRELLRAGSFDEVGEEVEAELKILGIE